MTQFDLEDFLSPLISWAPPLSFAIGVVMGWLILRSGSRLRQPHYIWSVGGAVAFFAPLSILRSFEGSPVWERFAATLLLWLIFEVGMAVGQVRGR